jgi:hypothetical protein
MSTNGTDGRTPRTPQWQQATRRKFWGWGLEAEGLSGSEIQQLGGTFARCSPTRCAVRRLSWILRGS